MTKCIVCQRKIKKGRMVCSKACDNEQFEQSHDGFFGRTRTCKYCGISTKYDIKKRKRYCPAGCF